MHTETARDLPMTVLDELLAAQVQVLPVQVLDDHSRGLCRVLWQVLNIFDWSRISAHVRLRVISMVIGKSKDEIVWKLTHSFYGIHLWKSPLQRSAEQDKSLFCIKEENQRASEINPIQCGALKPMESTHALEILSQQDWGTPTCQWSVNTASRDQSDTSICHEQQTILSN